MAREVEEESGDLEPSSLSVGLREGGCLHIVSLCVSSPEARSKLLLTRKDGWRPFYGMGGGGSKDNVVADSVDYSTNLSKDFAVLRLHGGISALVAGVAASAVLFYMAYRLFTWKRTKMNQARQRAPQGEGRFVWANQGRVDVEEGGGRAGSPGGFLWCSGPPSHRPSSPGLFMRRKSARSVGRRRPGRPGRRPAMTC